MFPENALIWTSEGAVPCCRLKGREALAPPLQGTRILSLQYRNNRGPMCRIEVGGRTLLMSARTPVPVKYAPYRGYDLLLIHRKGVGGALAVLDGARPASVRGTVQYSRGGKEGVEDCWILRSAAAKEELMAEAGVLSCSKGLPLVETFRGRIFSGAELELMFERLDNIDYVRKTAREHNILLEYPMWRRRQYTSRSAARGRRLRLVFSPASRDPVLEAARWERNPRGSSFVQARKLSIQQVLELVKNYSSATHVDLGFEVTFGPARAVPLLPAAHVRPGMKLASISPGGRVEWREVTSARMEAGGGTGRSCRLNVEGPPFVPLEGYIILSTPVFLGFDSSEARLDRLGCAE